LEQIKDKDANQSPLPTKEGSCTKIVFLVWAPYSSRAENLSERLNAHLYLISYKFKNKIYSPLKYSLLFARTIHILRKEKPKIIICQNPPIFCALSAIIYNYLFDADSIVVIDAHTGAFDRPWSYLKSLTKSIMKRASTIIVTNTKLQDFVLQNFKLKAIVLDDKIPEFNKLSYNNIERESGQVGDKGFKVAVISSFAYDEPMNEILDAAAELPTVRFYITGDASKAHKKFLKNKMSDNVVFTGFLNRDNYVSLLQQVDAVMVLTKRDNTMLSGTYEALALQKPLITSNWTPLKKYFYKGTIHVDNSPKEIEAAVKKIQYKTSTLAKEMYQLKLERTREWEEKFTNFKHLLENSSNKMPSSDNK
jgi:glycosyltransferase involved in cell wall biosynthesis